MKKLDLRMDFHPRLFSNKDEGFMVTANAVNLMSEKIDELVTEVNKLREKIVEMEKS